MINNIIVFQMERGYEIIVGRNTGQRYSISWTIPTGFSHSLKVIEFRKKSK